MVAFVDGSTGELPTEIDGSVCIIGAGAAGLTIARKLAERHSGVILIESGGLDIDGQTQGLYGGKLLGLNYYNLLSCRLRYFGGTTNHWSGYCRSNDPIDYEARPEIGLPGWPINHGTLEPYVAQAADFLGIKAEDFSTESALRYKGIDPAQAAENVSKILQTKAFLYATNLRLGKTTRTEITQSANIRPFLNTSLTHIQLNPEGTAVDHIVCRTLGGKQFKVRATKFVLSCHAIENARQLLLARDVQKDGIGNDTGHVGKYFMEHPYFHASKFIASDAFPWIYDRAYAHHKGLNINLGFTDAHTRAEGLLQYYCRFNPVFVQNDTNKALKRVWYNAFEPGDLEFLRDVATISSDLVGTVKYALSRSGYLDSAPEHYELEHRIEQTPNPDSRVVISDRMDALGMPIADLDWRLNDLDIEAFRKGQDNIIREISALGWGRVEEEEITRELVESRVQGHYHHMGTTRMSGAPSTGVVDQNCRVHGVNNLYVGGSSVFPTAGYSGPTMMIIALAIRMSEHIAGELA